MSRINYPALVEVIQTLDISDYVTTISERLDYLLALSLVEEYIKMSKMYDMLDISQSTRKKDRPLLIRMLEDIGFTMNSFPAKGVQIQSSEENYRIRLSQVFAQVIEIDHDDQVVQRAANTPLQRLIYVELAHCIQEAEPKLSQLVEMLGRHRVQLSYFSKKFLFVYYILARYRVSRGKQLEDVALPLTSDYPIFASLDENLLANAVLSSLDHSTELETEHNETIWQLCTRFVEAVEDNIITTFYSKQALVREVYRYVYKRSIRHALHYDIYDNKFMTTNLDSVSEELPFLSQQVEQSYRLHLEDFIAMDGAQLSTLTLILRKHVLANKIAGRNTKKVVLISNSDIEQTGFFAEQLKYYFDVEVVAALSIVELHALHDIDFQVLMCFSNRIAKMLHDLGFPCVKVPYFLHHADIDYLLSLDFSSNSHRKLLASDFTRKIAQVAPEQMDDYLRTSYPNIFI